MKCYKCGIRPAEIKEVGSENGVPYINYYCRKCYNEIKSNNGDRSGDRCLVCRKEYEEISKDWYVGCLECYETLNRRKLDNLMLKIHNRNYHIGKRPEEATLPSEEVADILESRYLDAMEKGDAVEAEMLRGQIKGLAAREMGKK